jgi:hypothetical protein
LIRPLGAYDHHRSDLCRCKGLQPKLWNWELQVYGSRGRICPCMPSPTESQALHDTPMLELPLAVMTHHVEHASSGLAAISRDQSWCFEVSQMLRKCVPATVEAVCVAVAEGRWNDVPQIDVASVLQAWKDAWWVWPQDADPRQSSGTAAAYCQWMSTDAEQPAPYVTASTPINSLHTLARFRLGVHHLNVSTGRWARVRRSDRLCPRCAGQHVEDEKHVMFECFLVF